MLVPSLFLSLFQNTAILVSFILLYDYFWIKDDHNRKWYEQILGGLFITLIGIVLMLTPWTMSEGVYLDTRSILLSVSGAFLGPIPTSIAAVLLSFYRIKIGGLGVIMGIFVIVSSSLIGCVYWYRFQRHKLFKQSVLSLWLLGIGVHVTIDRRVGATGNSANLVLMNSGTGTKASTIKLDNGAQGDTISYCTIKGGGGSVANGTILFGTTGNNQHNVVTNCNVTNNGTRRANAIYASAGSNTGNTISNNNLYDNWSAGSTSASINLATGSSDWTITGNSLYATSSFTSGTYSYYGINVSSPTGNNFVISGNYIGGSSAFCNGTLTMGTAGSTLYPISISVGTATASSVQGNVIKGITCTSSGATPFYGIYLANGTVNVGTQTGNVIGGAAGIDSIKLTASATTASSYGIYVAGTGTTVLSNNTIGAVTAANSTAANAHHFYGIYKANVSGDITISSNKIGSTSTSGSLKTSATATANAQNLFGIYSQGTGNVTITGNSVSNLTNATTNTYVTTTGSVCGIVSTAGTDTISGNTIANLTIANANNTSGNTAAVCGIVLSGTSQQTVTGNTIYGLSNTYGSFTGSVIGLYFSGATTGNTVSRNFINGLTLASTGASMYGMQEL